MTNRHTRWRRALEDVFSNLTDEEAKPLKSALSKVRLDEIHKSVMDELLNGDERRRKEYEEAEYEKELLRKATTLQANNQLYQNAQALGLAPGQYGQAVHNEMLRLGSHGSAGIGSVVPSTPLDAAVTGIVGRSPTIVIMDEYVNNGTLSVSNGGTGATPLERAKKFFSK